MGKKVEKDKKETAKLDAETVKEETVAKDAEEKIKEIEKRAPETLVTVTPSPTNAKVEFNMEPFQEMPKPPTPAPTSAVEKLFTAMSPKDCKDHHEWIEECKILTEYCDQFMAMRIFCKGSCQFCESDELRSLLSPSNVPAPAPGPPP